MGLRWLAGLEYFGSKTKRSCFQIFPFLTDTVHPDRENPAQRMERYRRILWFFVKTQNSLWNDQSPWCSICFVFHTISFFCFYKTHTTGWKEATAAIFSYPFQDCLFYELTSTYPSILLGHSFNRLSKFYFLSSSGTRQHHTNGSSFILHACVICFVKVEKIKQQQQKSVTNTVLGLVIIIILG